MKAFKHLSLLLLLGQLSYGSAIISPRGGGTVPGTVTGGTDGSVLFIHPANTMTQDNANFFYNTTSGFFGVGNAAPQALAHFGPIFSSIRTLSSTVKLALVGSGAVVEDLIGIGQPTFRMTRSGGTLSSPTTISDTNVIGQYIFSSYDGTNAVTTGLITALVNGSVSTGNVPTDLIFGAGTTTATERLRIKSNGVVNIAGLNSAGLVHTNSSGDLSTTAQAQLRLNGTASSITSSYAKITFTNTDYANNLSYASGAATVAVAGYYMVNASLNVSGTTSVAGTTAYGIRIVKNGSTVVREDFQRYEVIGAPSRVVSVHDTSLYSAADTIEVQAVNEAGTPVINASTTQNVFDITKVGD